eukprot:scaffold6944_cov158-Skeletonema_dohrnii-CCMP3373.AAC.2
MLMGLVVVYHMVTTFYDEKCACSLMQPSRGGASSWRGHLQSKVNSNVSTLDEALCKGFHEVSFTRDAKLYNYCPRVRVAK